MNVKTDIAEQPRGRRSVPSNNGCARTGHLCTRHIVPITAPFPAAAAAAAAAQGAPRLLLLVQLIADHMRKHRRRRPSTILKFFLQEAALGLLKVGVWWSAGGFSRRRIR